MDFTAPSPDNEEARKRWNIVGAVNCANQQHRQIMWSSCEEIEKPEGRAAGPLEVFDGKREWSTLSENADRLEDAKEHTRGQGARLPSRYVENVRKIARRGPTGRFALKRLNEGTKFKQIIKRR